MHEASLHDDNSYITLTYNDDHLPLDGSLDKKHFQDFMKRLRKEVSPIKIRFFHCGEYGEKFARPHYHALVFGYDFPDKKYFNTLRGHKRYVSELLEKIWGKGFCLIGSVTFESAAYVARYIMKKITGDDAEHHYKILDETTGELTDVQPEYVTMSTRPGIGHDWYQLYKGEIFPDDFIVIDGRKFPVPRYYTKLLERDDDALHADIKAQRVKAAYRQKDDATSERLVVREKVKTAQTCILNRHYEEE